jgi:AcrR family transcriptional regulator
MSTRIPPELKTRDAERSQKAILVAATTEFAEHGLGGARVDRIAERASLNKRLIYYYFKDKDSLFTAVLENAYTDIRQAEQGLSLKELSPIDALRRLTDFTWRYYIEHPEFITLLNSENLHKGRHLLVSDTVRKVNTSLIETLGEVLERGRVQGVLRGGVDPMQLYISIASLSYFYQSNAYTLSNVFGQDLMSPRMQAQRNSHIVDVILGYCVKA